MAYEQRAGSYYGSEEQSVYDAPRNRVDAANAAMCEPEDGPIAPVLFLIKELDINLEELHKAVGRLEAKLKFVLLPEPPTPENKTPQAIKDAPILKLLAALSDRIAHASLRLAILEDRVAV